MHLPNTGSTDSKQIADTRLHVSKCREQNVLSDVLQRRKGHTATVHIGGFQPFGLVPLTHDSSSQVGHVLSFEQFNQ